MPRITLLTDFGTRDGYVGAMKGVISGIFPGVVIDDVSHEVAPGDVAGASLTLSRYWDRYARGTVHVVVVDPGVGTARRALAVRADRRLLVAPDNGVLTRVLEAATELRAVEVSDPEYVAPAGSATFHGRDVFAPAAAYLALGVHLSRLGPSVEDPVRLPEPEPARDGPVLVGEVVSVDRFGNLVTNLPGRHLARVGDVEVAGRKVGVGRTYGEAMPGALLALANSDGRVEVAVRNGSAAVLLGVGAGAPVRIRLGEGDPGDP